MATAARTAMLGAGIGASLMYLLDPARGARRRALIRDKVVHAGHKTWDAYEATRRDVGNRLNGVAAIASARLHRDAADDAVIEARARAELGRVSTHARAVRVTSVDGCITLTGDALASEAGAIEAAIRNVRGVRDVSNRLNVHASPEHVPALQGTSARGGTLAWLTRGWSPTAKMLCGLSAVVAGAIARRRMS